MSPQTRTEIVELLEKHGLTPIHRLGQHFLADANITRKIVAISRVGPGDRVVEVGAGTGTLTVALAQAGAHVVAYEIDAGMRPVLEDVTEGLDVDLRFEDVMRTSFEDSLAPGQWVMVANLPYNVGTPVVLDALQGAPSIRRFVVTVQKEVADRMTATVGSGSYGLPSAIVGLYGEASTAFSVPPQVFVPPPQVESAVVVIERIRTPQMAERAVTLARAAFGRRRKMVRGSLGSILEDPVSSLEAAGLDPTSRAEDLSPTDYLRLAESSL